VRPRHGIAGLGSVHHQDRQRLSHFLPWKDDTNPRCLRTAGLRINRSGVWWSVRRVAAPLISGQPLRLSMAVARPDSKGLAIRTIGDRPRGFCPDPCPFGPTMRVQGR
jgi:hypothetical protein